MNKLLPIPETEQLQALASGLRAVYAMLRSYLGDLNHVIDFRRQITVGKTQLSNYLRQHPELAVKHVCSEKNLAKMHDLPVLFEKEGKWVVCWTDHGRKVDERTFEKLEDAAAHYLMAYW